METNKRTGGRRQSRRRPRPIFRMWKDNLKEWAWYVRENPGWFSMDIQGTVERGIDFVRSHVQQAVENLQHARDGKRTHRFHESEHRLSQLVLFIWGSLPRLGSALRERVLHVHKRRARVGGHRRRLFERIRLHPIGFLGGAAVIAVAVVLLSLYTVGTTAKYDGITLGTVSSDRAVKTAVRNLEQATRDTLGDSEYAVDLTLLETKWGIVSRSEVESVDWLEKELSKRIGKVDYGYVLYVDDEPTAATPFSGAMETLLEQLKVGYITPNTVDCYFQEKVEIREEYADAKYVMNLGYVAQLLNDTRQSEVTYTVKSGDVWENIADRYDMTGAQLLALNPGYNTAMIHVGDVLTVGKAISYLTVVDVERQNYLEDLPYKITYQDDDSMYQGDYEVLSAGEYGQADVTADVTYVNGEETDRKIVESVTLREPVDEVQARGTKERPSWFPTGSFRWPCSGRVTSSFGYRNTGIPGASTYHKGIDIANSYGTAILASDGGTVSYSGWMSGYGYLVIINHGNGYQTYYGHNSSLIVSVGDHVFKGQQIARMGSTGVSSANHCHFGVMKNGTFVNPRNYLP